MDTSAVDEVRTFYDDLADDYHLIYEDWWASVERQGQVLHGILEERLWPGPKRVLDCTAGVGTQSLGLSLLGHTVLGTDISESAITRACTEAESRSLGAAFQPWDVRSIADLPGGPYDVVLSADNSLPHLIDTVDLNAAVRGMWSQTAEPGMVLVTLRDYDQLVASRPTIEGPRVLGEPGNRRLIVQLWDWDPDEPIYRIEHLIISEEERGWRTSSRSCTYRALQRRELECCFETVGATDLEWLEPEASGFFQPILCVGRGSGSVGDHDSITTRNTTVDEEVV